MAPPLEIEFTTFCVGSVNVIVFTVNPADPELVTVTLTNFAPLGFGSKMTFSINGISLIVFVLLEADVTKIFSYDLRLEFDHATTPVPIIATATNINAVVTTVLIALRLLIDTFIIENLFFET
jgi:hypothetical protein